MKPVMGLSLSKPLKLALAALGLLALTACQGGGNLFGGKPAPAPAPGPVAGGPSTMPPVPAGMPIPPDPAGVLRPPNAGPDPIRIGLLLPLSHPSPEARAVAQALLDAAQMAVFESGNTNILLMPRDDKGTPDGAALAANELLMQGAEIIIGPLFAQSVTAAAPITRARNIPMLAFSTDRRSGGNGVYLLSFQPEEEVARIIQYAREQGRSRFAALIPQTPYGGLVEQAFRRSVTESGGTITATATYTLNQAAMNEPVRSIAQSGFDAVLIPEGGQGLKGLAPLLPYNNVDPRQVKFLGTGLWDDPTIVREPSVYGGWFAAPDPAARAAFAERFQASFGYAPPRIASLSYDAVSLVNAFSGGRPFERFTIQAFADPNGFAGVDGIFRFRPDGSIERGLAVIEVSGQGFTVISPAPATFLTPGF